ncbi:methylmalonyl-CoA mutase [Bacteroidetes/Chlorobi group bacterium MS-B_bin-24]|jgi:methylmalonyl-CoA mutase|nr:MAG: methylmalonyl-CoA mutase [Bacteroidetes/Chlorobi group bacterium MS-B_bin-24]
MNIKLLTATALFDGHDVSVNLFRRLLQRRGAEVIHLGHNRSVREVVTVAIQEDVDALLISSYQGGHNEYFRFLVDQLRELGAEEKQIFGGGGGVILPSEIKDLEEYGVTKLYHAIDGQRLGINGIADDIMRRIKENKPRIESKALKEFTEELIASNTTTNHFSIAKQITFIEEKLPNHPEPDTIREMLRKFDKGKSLVIGFTGPGGCGKSSLIDELIGRFLAYVPNISIAVLASDPTKSTTGGALLGDRIRYNHIYDPRVFFRSFATRNSGSDVGQFVRDSIDLLKTCGFDLILVETPGIGQGDSQIKSLSDFSVYVMTAEFGAPSQLEKIDMLDLADYIAINKFEKIGSEDALREVIIHYIRTHQLNVPRGTTLESLDLPIFACSSNQFNNHGVNKFFKALLKLLRDTKKGDYGVKEDVIELLPTELVRDYGLINNRRINYLAEIAETVRKYKKMVKEQSQIATEAYSLKKTLDVLRKENIDGKMADELNQLFQKKWSELSKDSQELLLTWEDKKRLYQQDKIKYKIQNQEVEIDLYSKSICGSNIPKVALPKFEDWGNLLKFLYLENLPGFFPYTAGVFPFKRTTEDPKRQFAGEGGPARTNKRFHFLTKNDRAKRLSVAFDGVTLYGEDPARDPDIYGKIGESGVSVCTIEDMDVLLQGFDQTDPLTSVSMTINAPAPIMVAFYFMVAYKRELEKLKAQGIELSEEEKEKLKIETFRKLRGTVQADMLKEDQGQNTCIFSIDFAMRLIGDVQEYLSKHKIRNYYSLSISGYHIAEAGANPITQLAFTLANGFTYVEYFLNRGIPVDEFAPNLSFFFSNGMDPEYSVIGRVARRIWAIAMKYVYGANERSQKLKYHIQTSGRSLHAQEIDFNDIRTTLQGLLAMYDNCNSLHTNSYDEAITTPTEESVRRAMAIQLILSKEFGILKNENPNQGSFIIEELTDLVEEAVLDQFLALSRRGGVLGAMETQYQRSKIQEQSLYYESLKESGEYPIIGVNTFINENPVNYYDNMKVTRATIEEKEERLQQVADFKERHKDKKQEALDRLRNVALSGGNIFEEMLNAVEHCTMGEITQLLYQIGGKYRRGM